MKFEEFEKEIQERGYSIVCLNHYYQRNRKFTFCVILNTTTNKAFKAEYPSSEGVFNELIERMRENEN